jgi:hypothetical protein
MKGVVSAHSLGAVAPYIISAGLLIPITGSTANTTTLPEAGAGIYMNIAQLNRPPASESLTSYVWDLTRPQLSPDALVGTARQEWSETYEPFIASEGWREQSAPKGPFLVEEEPPQRAFFDDYDLSAIALYEQE